MNTTCSHFTAVCPGCQVGLKINHKYSGQWVRCQHCDKKFQAVAPDSAAPSDSTETETPLAPPLENGSRLSITCPSCATRLSVRAKYAGRHIRCGMCERKFQVGGQAPGPREGEPHASPSAALARLTEAAAALAARNKRLRERQHELRRAFLQLQAEFKRIAARDQDAAGEQGLVELKRLHDELRTDLDFLKQQLEADAQPAQRDRAEAQLRHDGLAAAIDDLKLRIETDARPDRHDRELAELKLRHDETARVIDHLQAQLRTVEAETASQRGHDIAGLAQRHDDLTAAIEEMKAQVRKLDSAAPPAQSGPDAAELAPRLDDLKREIDLLKRQHEAHSRPEAGGRDAAQLERLLGRQDDLSTAVDDLKARVQAQAAGLSGQSAPDAQELALLKYQSGEATREVDLMKLRLNRVENLLTRSTMEATALREQNSQSAGRHEATSRAIEDLKAQLQAAQEELAAFKEHAQDARDDARPRPPVGVLPAPNLASIEGPAAFAFHGRSRNSGR